MSVSLPGWLCAAVALGLPVLRAQDAGLPPEWEVRKNIAALVEQTGRLKTLLDGVNAGAWAEKGAPEAYQVQWKSVLAESEYLTGSAGKLAADPERLSLALVTYFRMQSLDAQLASLNEGVRKYQDPELADLIRAAMSEGAAGREKLREYIVLLAQVQEGQLKVMDAEAQRCRSMLLRPAPVQKSPEKKAVPK